MLRCVWVFPLILTISSIQLVAMSEKRQHICDSLYQYHCRVNDKAIGKYIDQPLADIHDLRTALQEACYSVPGYIPDAYSGGKLNFLLKKFGHEKDVAIHGGIAGYTLMGCVPAPLQISFQEMFRLGAYVSFDKTGGPWKNMPSVISTEPVLYARGADVNKSLSKNSSFPVHEGVKSLTDFQALIAAGANMFVREHIDLATPIDRVDNQVLASPNVLYFCHYNLVPMLADEDPHHFLPSEQDAETIEKYARIAMGQGCWTAFWKLMHEWLPSYETNFQERQRRYHDLYLHGMRCLTCITHFESGYSNKLRECIDRIYEYVNSDALVQRAWEQASNVNIPPCVLQHVLSRFPDSHARVRINNPYGVIPARDATPEHIIAQDWSLPHVEPAYFSIIGMKERHNQEDANGKTPVDHARENFSEQFLKNRKWCFNIFCALLRKAPRWVRYGSDKKPSRECNLHDLWPQEKEHYQKLQENMLNRVARSSESCLQKNMCSNIGNRRSAFPKEIVAHIVSYIDIYQPYVTTADRIIAEDESEWNKDKKRQAPRLPFNAEAFFPEPIIF